MSQAHACSPSTQEVGFRLRVLLHYPVSLKPAWAPWVSLENITNKAKKKKDIKKILPMTPALEEAKKFTDTQCKLLFAIGRADGRMAICFIGL